MGRLNWLQRVLGKQSPDNFPAWYQTYLNQAGRLDPTTAFDELNIAVIDGETTGLDIKTDQLISLGGLKVRQNKVLIREQFEGYLRVPAGKYGDGGSVIIHGILPGSGRYTYSDPEELIRKFLRYVGGSVIVGHHIGFDVSMINRQLAELGAGPLVNLIVDTAKLARLLAPAGYWTPNDNYTLDSLARRYGVGLSDRHTAMGDAFITAVLFLKLTARLRERRGRDLELGDLQPSYI